MRLTFLEAMSCLSPPAVVARPLRWRGESMVVLAFQPGLRTQEGHYLPFVKGLFTSGKTWEGVPEDDVLLDAWETLSLAEFHEPGSHS